MTTMIALQGLQKTPKPAAPATLLLDTTSTEVGNALSDLSAGGLPQKPCRVWTCSPNPASLNPAVTNPSHSGSLSCQTHEVHCSTLVTSALEQNAQRSSGRKPGAPSSQVPHDLDHSVWCVNHTPCFASHDARCALHHGVPCGRLVLQLQHLLPQPSTSNGLGDVSGSGPHI